MTDTAAVTTTAASTRSVRNEFFCTCMKIPSPAVAPTYSAKIAPVTA